CLYDAGTRLGAEVIEDLERYFESRRRAQGPWSDAAVFRTRIRRNIRLAECPSFGQSIFQYAPSSRGAADYASLAAEVQGRPATGSWAPSPSSDPATAEPDSDGEIRAASPRLDDASAPAA